MGQNNYPSADPSNSGSLVGAFNHIIDKNNKTTDGMLPAQIVSYDRATNRATVKPLIQMVGTDGNAYDRAILAKVPVFQMGGGGFFISFNLKAGDLGWISACDRDISLFLQSYAETKPNTERVKNFADAVFYPDIMTKYTITDTEDCVIQNLDGSVKIVLSDTGITIKAPSIALESDTLTHNGVNIGDTHVHSGVSTGTSNTGVPQ